MIDISNIPGEPGIYLFKTKADKLLYIGKAKNLKKRVSQYFLSSSLWKTDMVAKASKVDFLVVNSESEALLLENNLINKFRPPYNSLLKGDNAYIYIKITKEKFPNILMTRFRNSDGAIYIGPKPLRGELKKLLQFLRQFLKFRTCNSTLFNKGVGCSEYMFGICKGRCKQKNDIVLQQEYQKIVSLIVDFFKGKSDSVEKEILNQIQNAVDSQNFERAARLRDVYFNLSKFTEKQNVILDKSISGYFFLVKEIGEYYAYVILNFFEGKLIDIIRYKQKIEDESLSELIKNFEQEFGEFKIEDNFGYSKSIKSLKKDQKNEILDLSETFIQSFIISSSFEKESLLGELLKQIKYKYVLKNFPYKIEATDISHLSGGWISGSLVSMSGGILNKKGYRRYKIKSVKTISDDYQSLKELISRRFAANIKDQNFDNIPDVFILDGGKGQLGILKKLYDENDFFKELFNKIDFLSLGKGKSRTRSGKISGSKEKIFKFIENFDIVELEMDYDDADKLLIRLRDEAHRFANKYRQKQMSSEFKSSK